MSAFNNIGLALRPVKNTDFNGLVSNLCRWLLLRKKNIYLIESEQAWAEEVLSEKIFASIQFVSEESFHQNVDLIVSLGGDGTLIGVCRSTQGDIPIFGVNLGRLGFIAEFSKSDLYDNLTNVFKGSFELTQKSIYVVKVIRRGKERFKGQFFNDAVISKHDIARMFTISLEANGEHISYLSGDGVIVSSTMGSTAYSLAAGGPIVHPEVKAIIITPVCPHSLTHRPLVIPDNYLLKLKVSDTSESVALTLDGQRALSIDTQDSVIIEKDKKKKVSLIKNPDRTYFHTLKEKLIHGKRSY